MATYYLSIGAGSSNMSTVPWVESADAPTVEGDFEGGKSNTRRIDASRLQGALQAAGLTATMAPFFTGSPVIQLTQEQRDAVHAALEKWKTDHSMAQPRFSAEYAGDYKGVEEATVEDAILGLLTWMDFWMTWALANCKVPAVMVR